MVTCSSGKESSESWLIDSGCTNHMTYDKKFFEELRDTEVKRVRIGNGEHLEVKGKGTVAITSYKGIKFIPYVLFVPKINQNLLSLVIYLRKAIKYCLRISSAWIKDASENDLFNVKMRGKNFPVNLPTSYQELVPLRFGTKDLGTFIIEDCFRCNQRSR